MSQKGQHSKPARPDGRGRHRLVLLASGVVVLAAAGGVAAVTTAGPVRHLLAIGSPGEGGGGVVPTTIAVPATTEVPLPKVVSVSPRAGSAGVASDAPITIELSRPPAPGAPVPTLTPAIPGQWSVDGATLTFIPTGRYQPWSEVDLTVPAGAGRSRHGQLQRAGRAYSSHRAVAGRTGLPPGQLHPGGRATGVKQRTDRRVGGQPGRPARQLLLALLQRPVVIVLALGPRPGQRRAAGRGDAVRGQQWPDR